MFKKCIITQRNIIPKYNKNVFMALKHCPFPHRYVESGNYIEIKNESIYKENYSSFEEIVKECFEPLNRYGLGLELNFLNKIMMMSSSTID